MGIDQDPPVPPSRMMEVTRAPALCGLWSWSAVVTWSCGAISKKNKFYGMVLALGWGWGWGWWWWWWWTCSLYDISVLAEHLGASSRRLRHPFPALMAGVSPGRVPVHTAKKVKPGANCGASTVCCTVSTIPGTVQSCWRQCISALSGPCAPVEPVSTAQQGRRPPHVRQLEESLWSSSCRRHEATCSMELHTLHNRDEDHLVKL